jgi:hypothetical protein
VVEDSSVSHSHDYLLNDDQSTSLTSSQTQTQSQHKQPPEKQQQQHQPMDSNGPSNGILSLSTTNTTSFLNSSLSYSSTSTTTAAVVIERASKTRHPQNKPQKSFTQVYIDCGQSTFGQIACTKCGMSYMPGIREDDKHHARHCKSYIFGIQCFQGNVTNGKVVERTVDYSIVRWKASNTTTTTSSGSGSSSSSSSTKKRRRTTATSNRRSYGSCDMSGPSTDGNDHDGKSAVPKRKSTTAASTTEADTTTESQPKNVNTTPRTKTNLPSQWPLLARMIARDLGMEESVALRHLSEQIIFLYIGRPTNSRQATTSCTDNNNTIRSSFDKNSIGIIGRTTSSTTTTMASICRTPHSSSSLPPSRILGVVTVQGISHAYRMPTLHDRSLVPERAILGVGLLWTHSSARRCGIASRLVTAAREYAIFGMRVPVHRIAFSSPTQSGYAFTWKYCFPQHHQGGVNYVVPAVPTPENEDHCRTTPKRTYSEGMIDQLDVEVIAKDVVSYPKRDDKPVGPLVYEMI